VTGPPGAGARDNRHRGDWPWQKRNRDLAQWGPAPPANLEGGLALFVSALQGSLAAGSAAGGVIYDAKGPGGALWAAAAVAAAGSLTLLSRAGASISSPPAGSVNLACEPAGKRRRRLKARSTEQENARNEHAEVTVRGHTEAATRKELLCPTRS
jgi:hypothetical protein